MTPHNLRGACSLAYAPGGAPGVLEAWGVAGGYPPRALRCSAWMAVSAIVKTMS
jgi:hypothetical protein